MWSYSSVHQYDDCPYGFKLQRIDRVHKVNNVFAEYGTFMHHLLELYFTGVAKFYELQDIYLADYEKNVTLKFPYNKWTDLSEDYYNSGLSFLQNFKGLSSRYRIIGVELEDRLDIGGFPTVGYIDLLLEDQTDGELIIVDHKSKKKFVNKKEELDYRRQLLFYGHYVKHMYGKYPKELDFNMFRTHSHIVAPFSVNEYEKVMKWFCETIESTYKDEVFEDKIERSYYEKFKDIDDFKRDDFFCNEICSVRESCMRSKAYKKPKVKRTAKKKTA